MRKLFLSITAGLVITVLTGVVYGRLSQRWGPTSNLTAAARQLETFPKEIGDWQLLSEEPMSKHIVETLSCAGYVNRQYVNQKTGETIWIAITVGPAGPISVHTPEICYSSKAYSIRDDRSEVTLKGQDGRTHTFWSLSFNPKNSGADMLRVYYAWCDTGEWSATASPRFTFAGRPSLHKLQMSTLVPSTDTNESKDPCKKFLTDLLRSEWRFDG